MTSACLPSALRGWCEALTRYGTCSLPDVLQPAIRHAERRFRATQYLHEIIRKVAPDIARFPETARLYLPDGRPPSPGDVIRNGEYADTLRLIADQGADALYHGALGESAASYIQGEGGLVTRADIAGYRTVHGDVVRGTYRGCDVIGPAPPSAGGVQVVEMLNILEAFGVGALGFGTADGVHLLAEVMKLGFDDRRRYTGDPDYVDVPVDMLVSKAYAEERRAGIDMGRASTIETAYRPGESDHTTHVTAADADGNVMTATHTIHAAFGSKATVPGTGMLLNNTMNIFDPHPGLANSIQPGKRMTSSMAPIIVERDGRPVFALGSVGGTRIFPSVLQAIVNVIDHGMSFTEAVEAPRVWTLGDVVEIEAGYPAPVLAELGRRGHTVQELKIVGAGMSLVGFADDVLTGASCWRADGTPVGIAGGMARPGVRFDV